MRSTLRVGLFLPVALGAWSPPAEAQDYTTGRRELISPPGWFGPGPAWHKWSDPGPGPGWTYYRVPDGPTVVVAGPAGDFRTNDRGLYGPPMTVYAPIAASAGCGPGGHFSRRPPADAAFCFGLGWLGYRSPSPRHVPLTVDASPQAPAEAAAPAPPAEGACIRLAVKVPIPDADVWIEKTPVAQKGTDRLFESPPLEAGLTYRYEVVARWKADGLERSESRTVTGTPGQTLAVDFTKPAEGK